MDIRLQALANLRQRLPEGRRSRELYKRLDVEVPLWGDLVSMPEFATWAGDVDSTSGNSMLGRIVRLLDDPVYATKDLAVILRMFRTWIDAGGGTRTPTQSNRVVVRPGKSHERGRLPVLSNKYELVGLLGRGGNGEVYLAWSSETETFYALKTIRAELSAEARVRRSFRQEALAWISMGEHANVAKAYFFEEIAARLYIAMAFVEGDDEGVGPSLEDKVSGGDVGDAQLITWFCQVADGLSHAYACGIRAHRDIKPGNILISREGVAQISDFGLVLATDTLVAGGTNDGLAVGTPLFMSPEQFGDSESCDQRSDVYSLGVSLYQAASGGQMPFMPSQVPKTPEEFGSFVVAVRALHQSARPKVIRSALWPIVERCLQKNPADRFSGVGELRTALGSIARRLHVHVPVQAVSSSDFWVLRDQANTFMRLGRYEEAIRAYDEFLVVMPDDSAAFNRAVCLENIGQHELALTVYERFARRNDLKGVINAVGCLRKLSRNHEALDYAERAVAMKRDDPDCWIAMGNAQFGLQDWQEAMVAYQTAHELDPGNPTPAYNFGLAALRAGRVASAKEGFNAFMSTSMLDDVRRDFVARKLEELDAT